MRFILTAAVWIIIMTAILLLFSVRTPQSADEQVEIAQHNTSVSFEITTTFGVEQDPFALDIGEELSPFSIMLDGETIFSTDTELKDRVPFTTKEIPVSYGLHELFIKGNPSDTTISQAVRVVVLNHGNIVNEATYWFQSGQTVNASHTFMLEEKEENNEH